MNKAKITSEKAWEIHDNIRHKDYFVTTEMAWRMFRWDGNGTYSFRELREEAVELWRNNYERERYYRMWNSSPYHRKEIYPGMRKMLNQRAELIEKLKAEAKQ